MVTHATRYVYTNTVFTGVHFCTFRDYILIIVIGKKVLQILLHYTLFRVERQDAITISIFTWLSLKSLKFLCN